MRAVISGIRYDTAAAEFLWEDEYGTESDFDYHQERLYKTASGRYFISGRGGPASHYRKSVDRNSWTGGAGIRPLTLEEALEWAEMHMPTRLIEEHFGDLIKDA